jgi:hypothetical protein
LNLVIVRIYCIYIREDEVGKVAAHLCLTLIVKELKFSVEHGRVVTTLSIIFCVATLILNPGPSTNLQVTKDGVVDHRCSYPTVIDTLG